MPLEILRPAVSLLLFSIGVIATEVYDDDLTQTNADAEGYSASACGRYLCSKYSYEAKQFLKDGCEGDFESYLPSSGISQGQVTIGAALLVAAISFLSAFVVGVLFGRFHKFKNEDKYK